MLGFRDWHAMEVGLATHPTPPPVATRPNDRWHSNDLVVGTASNGAKISIPWNDVNRHTLIVASRRDDAIRLIAGFAGQQIASRRPFLLLDAAAADGYTWLPGLCRTLEHTDYVRVDASDPWYNPILDGDSDSIALRLVRACTPIAGSNDDYFLQSAAVYLTQAIETASQRGRPLPLRELLSATDAVQPPASAVDPLAQLRSRLSDLSDGPAGKILNRRELPLLHLVDRLQGHGVTSIRLADLVRDRRGCRALESCTLGDFSSAVLRCYQQHAPRLADDAGALVVIDGFSSPLCPTLDRPLEQARVAGIGIVFVLTAADYVTLHNDSAARTLLGNTRTTIAMRLDNDAACSALTRDRDVDLAVLHHLTSDQAVVMSYSRSPVVVSVPPTTKIPTAPAR
ncbi:MAG TPA: hypothetical protein VFQ88_07335 [Nevskiaceae bacterium]|nr:hypothetical protein [Nevskiaceae bacterium]